jgi:hypothetical protein
MASTNTVTGTLDVISKYNALVKESLGGDSVYIRAKETLQELVKDGSIDDSQKAKIISEVLGSAVNSITNSSMAAALDWSKAEKDVELKKLEMDQQLNILSQEIELKTAQKDQIDNQIRLTKVESKRVFGTGTFDVSTGALMSLVDEGKVWTDMQLAVQQTTNAGVEENLLASKINESQVAIHKVVADTYVNFGAYTFTYGAGGNGIEAVTQKHLGSHLTLSETQKDIAIEQGKGYTYNAWANALTGSASILGTAIASGDFNFEPGTSGDILLRTVINCANNLAVSDGVSSEATPVDKVTVPANITV